VPRSRLRDLAPNEQEPNKRTPNVHRGQRLYQGCGAILRSLDTGGESLLTLRPVTGKSEPAGRVSQLRKDDKTMRKLLLMLAVVALLVPVAALADTAPTAASAANQLCKDQQKTLGSAFASTYGTNADKSNAFGKCVAKNTPNGQNAVTNASKACSAEETSLGAAAFEQKYGTNGKTGTAGALKDAMGKCVSGKVKSSVAAAAAAAPSALKTCKADRKSDPTGFATKYGTSKDALGKCVSSTAKTK
jgi:hypothetical protein